MFSSSPYLLIACFIISTCSSVTFPFPSSFIAATINGNSSVLYAKLRGTLLLKMIFRFPMVSSLAAASVKYTAFIVTWVESPSLFNAVNPEGIMRALSFSATAYAISSIDGRSIPNLFLDGYKYIPCDRRIRTPSFSNLERARVTSPSLFRWAKS